MPGLLGVQRKMKIDSLLNLVREKPAYKRLLQIIGKNGASAAVIEAARPYLLAALHTDLKRPMLVVTSRPEQSRLLAEQLSAWLNTGNVTSVPEPNGLPYTRSGADALNTLERLRVLSALTAPGMDSTALILVTSVAALMQKLPSATRFREGWIAVNAGCQTEPLSLVSKLLRLGYHSESMVEVPGTFSRRGDILDIFPPLREIPARLEFFGNEIESIRSFDPLTQRSFKTMEKLHISPATEIAPHFIDDNAAVDRLINSLKQSDIIEYARQKFGEDIEQFKSGRYLQDSSFYAPLLNTDCLFDYLPRETLTVLDAPEAIQNEARFFIDTADKVLEQRVAGKEIPTSFPAPYLAWSDINAGMDKSGILELASGESTDNSTSVTLGFASAQSYAGQMESWVRELKRLREQRTLIAVVSHQSARLLEILSDSGIQATVVEEITGTLAHGSIILVQGLLAKGWKLGKDVCLFTDSELFGFVKQQRLSHRRPVARHKLLHDIRQGDYVVHIEHGIGRFSGVMTMQAGGLMREYMLLTYAAGDHLYVPTDQADRVERYIGAADKEPSLTRLGSLEWVHSKEKARQSAANIAEELLEIYAAREVIQGFSYSADNPWQMELEASFPYVETPDQLTAIARIKEDMSQVRPMDRLVCGDVGYGKTEVALRAAFKAVMDGKQVAVLVPTTVLAQQHYTTFKERLSAFPIRVESLSRFKSHREQQEIVSGIADGAVDIAIGTHRLLQKDIAFKDLGLLVIDEEQRFGVTHKEHFKRLRREIDVLTLSATPIPRTLNLSLAGVRDMSVMETPPEDRLPVRTFVAEYNVQLIHEAIVRELERGGQVFFVHNRVQNIGILAEKLKVIVPEAKIGVGHGQMPEEALEKVMADFASHNIDVLLCTTIIESGLDIPNANTLIVNHADKMGLTQLYQLRGRIGRGASTAYAYFLYDKGTRLTPDADQRLRTIYEATELGAGFGIAMKDLEIRGAGNILGVRQSGHINSVGFSLYSQLLAEAVEDQKSRKAAEKNGKTFTPPLKLPAPTVALPQSAFIPESYVADTDTRLSLYKSLAGARNPETVESLSKDFKDRFGEFPPEVKNLLYAVKVKVLAASARLESVSTENGQIVLRRPFGTHFDIAGFGAQRAGIKVSVNQIRLDTDTLGHQWTETLEDTLLHLSW